MGDWKKLINTGLRVSETTLFQKLGAVEIGQEYSEFISAMKAMEATIGKEKMSQFAERYKDVFAAADRHHIIVYELKI